MKIKFTIRNYITLIRLVKIKQFCDTKLMEMEFSLIMVEI